MKNRNLFVAVLMFALNAFAADPLTERLQRGLFEEEANRNLDAAIREYQSVVTQADEQRKVVATALFRLGECYRKLGRTNDATAQYQRIVRDFAEQEPLVKLSRDVLGARNANTLAVAADLAASALTQAEAEELARVKSLAQNSPDLLNAIYKDNMTPLQFAAREGYYQVASFLLNNGSAPNPISPDAKPPLVFAAEKGHLRIVELLLDKGADINASYPSGTALLLASQMGFKNVVELLLARSADVNGQGANGETALHQAVFKGNAALVELLLARGAKTEARLRIAYSNWQLPQDIGGGITPLHLASYRGFRAIAELLLKAGASVEATNFSAQTPLHFAARGGQTNLCSLLLDQGANANARSSTAVTPLSWAIQRGGADLVALLLRRGADPNLPEMVSPGFPFYPLHRAVERRTAPLLEALLAAKPNLEVISGHNATPLQQAVSQQFDDMAELLLQAGANPDLADANGNTLLHVAVGLRMKLTVALLQRGANPNVVNRSGETPLSLVLSALKQSRPQVGGVVTMPGVPQPPTFYQGGPGLISEQAAAYEEIARLLRAHGADEFLQRRGFISAVRGPQQRVTIFSKGTNNVNRYTLMEFLAAVYEQGGSDFAFPDFAKITIHRVATWKGPLTNLPPGVHSVNAMATVNTKTPILVNFAALLAATNCAGDLPLEWGDEVEIPMADHPVSAQWPGMVGRGGIVMSGPLANQPSQGQEVFNECLQRVVRFTAGGTNVTFDLLPAFADLRRGPSNSRRSPFFRLSATVLRDNRFRNLLRSSSDLSRVTVTRLDPQTKETKKMTFDLNAVALPDVSYSSGNPPPIPWAHDLWLRDGDVIEVPEKP